MSRAISISHLQGKEHKEIIHLTTSLLERTNRELRRKFRQAVTFGSVVGAEVVVYLQVQRLHAQWTNVPSACPPQISDVHLKVETGLPDPHVACYSNYYTVIIHHTLEKTLA